MIFISHSYKTRENQWPRVDQTFKHEKISQSLKKLFVSTKEISETKESTPAPKNVKTEKSEQEKQLMKNNFFFSVIVEQK